MEEIEGSNIDYGKKKKPAKKTKVKRMRAKLFGHRINEVLAQQNMCAKELADLIDTNAPHMCRILASKRPCLSLPIAMKISKALNTPIEELFYLDKPVQIKSKLTTKVANK